MKKIHLSLIFLILWHPFANAEINQVFLDKKVQNFVKAKPVKAMVYGLWIKGQPISIKALGESMTAVPATTEMHFRIGGVTETMLTTVLMQLVERNKIALDAKIARWFPDLPNASEVSLQMLANGTSGYPDYVFNKKFDEIDSKHPFKKWTDKELIDLAFLQPPLFKPGASQHYSHTDYVLLGNILSQIANKPLGELLQSNILTPLGMKETRFDLTAEIPSPVLHSFSDVRTIYEDATYWSPSWTSSSGSMVSTINDLGKWANAWLKGSLVTPESTKQLRATDTVGKGSNKPNLYFAMGFGVANHWLMQNPSFGGYSGIFAVLPEKNIVFIAFNTLQPGDKTNTNWSKILWQVLATELSPENLVPHF
ncbi:MAG: beta-lactamase family protein [Tatlockia sp.]|nr:beta-lactamase family protein [Tatlockia sp.]